MTKWMEMIVGTLAGKYCKCFLIAIISTAGDDDLDDNIQMVTLMNEN